MRTTGAVAPSGTALAHALTEPVRSPAHGPLTVLEAGAGTGAVTRALLSHLAPGSRLDVAEANPRFADRLRQLAVAHAHGAHAAPHSHGAAQGHQVRVHIRPVEELETDRTYDAVVSGLPFANFTPEYVQVIMERYLELLRPGGTLTYFADLGTRQARTLLASRSRKRHQAVEEVLAGYRRRYATDCRTVWANLPPAKVWQLQRPVPAAPRPRPAAEAAR